MRLRRVLLVASVVLTCGCRSTPDEPAPRPKASASPTLRTLKLEGIEVQVPRSMVDLEADRVKRLEEAAKREEPSATYGFAAVRDAAGMMAGTVYVQRSDLTRPLPPGTKTVREALRNTVDEAEQMLAASGMRIAHTEKKERDGGLEVCFEAQMAQGAGKVAAMHVCTLFTVTPEERLRGLTVSCMSKPGVSLCTQVQKSRKYEPGKARELESELSEVPVPGLPGVEKSSVAGVRFGASKAVFAAACRKAGHEVDDFDWDREPPAVRTWAKEGRIGRCSGPLAGVDWAKIVAVGAMFQDGALVSATLYVADEEAEVRKKLAHAYPDSMRGMGRSLHVIHRDATGHELATVSVGPTTAPGAKSLVTFLSRKGVDMPPLVP